jgi:hypothetical protein
MSVYKYMKSEVEKMTTHAKNHIPWYLWPFAAIWKLLAVIVEMTGRLVVMILGIVLMIVGPRQPDDPRSDRWYSAGNRGVAVVPEGNILKKRQFGIGNCQNLWTRILSVFLRTFRPFRGIRVPKRFILNSVQQWGDYSPALRY